MPLVISAHTGEDFYVGDQQFVVTRIYDETSFTIEKPHASETETFEVTERQSEEVMPNVFVSAGDLFQKGVVRVVIDAPREILILRGDKYREVKARGT